ncbi:IS200/IS605 family transposase, partial [Haloarcula laminariae]|uniref:IS200/IS605 family transposase n=1 Tax=Haloarcula laminariae TaxID=2961577 RepID=UPI00387DCCE9
MYALQYHFVTVTKYRADILTDARLERVAEIAHDIADDFEAEITNVNGGTDHIHILFRTKPPTDLTKFSNSLKGVMSRRVRKEFTEVSYPPLKRWACRWTPVLPTHRRRTPL